MRTLGMIFVVNQNEGRSFRDPLPQSELPLTGFPLGQKPAGTHKTVFFLKLQPN